MKITIKKLDASLAKTYVDFLGGLSFGHMPHWASCYCRYYHTDCSSEVWMSRSAEENKADALKAIRSGEMKGYLAFAGEQCIGWMNANDAKAYPRLKDELAPLTKEHKAGLIICFVVHPDYRKMGVATALMKAAVRDFKVFEYDLVAAAPVEIGTEEIAFERLYRGPVSMYAKAGFKKLPEHPDFYVLNLKGEA